MAKLQTNHELTSDKSKNPVVSSEFVKHGNKWLDKAVDEAVTAVNAKADKTYVDSELAKKATTEAVATVDAKVNGKADANVVSQLQATVNTKADASTVAALSERVTANTTGITEANSRIDAIVALPEGSTTGDAELIDIRTKADGTKATSAGAAVREQVTDLKSEISEGESRLSDSIMNISDAIELTYINNVVGDENTPRFMGYLDLSNGSFISGTNPTWWTTDYIELDMNKLYKFECEYVNTSDAIVINPRAIGAYDENKNFVLFVQASDYNRINNNKNIKYIRVNITNCKELKKLKIYPTEEGIIQKHTSKIIDDIGLELWNVKKDVKDVREIMNDRVPTICFSLDGDYDMNVGISNIAEEYGYRIGIALSFLNKFDVFPISRYLELQSNGHEIMNHSGINVGEGSPYTPEQIAQKIKENHDFMIENGFNVTGFVAYQSNTVPSTIEVVKKYYDYGATEHNHSGSYSGYGAESNMYINNASPYHIWRYSMTLSTLQQMKDAVDKCVATNGLLHFYGHADSNNQGYLTYDNFKSLLSYINSKNIRVVLPKDSIIYFMAKSNDYTVWEQIQPTASENYQIMYSDIKVNKNLGLCNFNVRLKSMVTQNVSGTLLSGIPNSALSKFYLQTNLSALRVYAYDNGNLMVDKSEQVSENDVICITGFYSYKE